MAASCATIREIRLPKENRLKGKVAIITGAASGIGDATVDLFLEQGACVAAVDLPTSQLEDRHGSKDNVLCIPIDVTDEDAAGSIVARTVDRFGALHILFNNAGVCPVEPYMDMADDTWNRTMAVNVRALDRLTRAAAPHMKHAGSGRIINTGSVQSDVGGFGLTAYTVSKHAVAALTKQQAVELGAWGITANYLQPGFIVTGITAPTMNNQDFVDYWKNRAPVGRLGQPIDIAYAALFLAQDASNFITGVGMKVDGGAMAKL